MSGVSLVFQALSFSQNGKRGEAVAILRAARDAGPLDDAATSLLFALLGEGTGQEVVDIDDDDHDERLELCDHALGLSPKPLLRSTWLLRRGLVHLERKDAKGAVLDLQGVLRLAASPTHEQSARAALLRAAAIMSRR